MNLHQGAWLIALALFIISTKATSQEQWNYDTVSEPLPYPEFVDRIAVVAMYYNSPFDVEQGTLKPWAKRLQDAGFTIVAMYPDSFIMLYDPKPGEPQADYAATARKEIALAHSLGVKVLAGVYPFVGVRGPRDLLTAHPEYRLVNDEVKNPDPGSGCLVQEGYGRAVIELLTQRARDFKIDGFQFDGWYQCTYCACEGCKQLYKAQTGLAVPPKKDPLSLDYRKYVAWRDKILLQRLTELRESVKKVNPDFMLVNWNNNDPAGASPSWMPEALNTVADWTNKEFWDAYDISSVWLGKRLRGSSGNERVPGIQPYMFMRWGKDIEAGTWHGSSTPQQELFYRLHEIMTFGGNPITWSGARQGWTDQDWERFVDDLITYMPYVQKTKSLKYAVCIDSYSTLQSARTVTTNRAFHEGAGNELDGAIGNHRAGMARALLESHIPFDIISEHNVTAERLGEYRVVILPNNFAMSDRIAAELRRFVEKGGGLVATYQTSLFNEWGEPRTDFALADLYGASYLSSEPAAHASRVDFTTQSQAISDDPAMRAIMGTKGMSTFWGKYLHVKPVEGALAPFKAVDGTLETKQASKDPGDAVGKAKDWIPLLTNEAKGGRVAYFPAGMDAAYHEASYPYQRMMLSNAVRWAAKDTPSVKVEAPMCVLAGFFIKEAAGKRQTIVHLLNDINSSTGHGNKDDKEFAMREEVVQIGGIKVSFMGEKPARVFNVPGNTELNAVQSDAGWTVEVPALGLHAVVVAEY